MFNLVVFIHVKKAFDTVNHDILLRKLELYRIKGQALNLLKSYLSSGHQKCQIGNFFSTEQLIRCSVPHMVLHLGTIAFLVIYQRLA